MTNEVYQLQVNGTRIPLGKGSNADDEFVSKKEASSMAISAFAYFNIQITEQDVSETDPICICIPGFSYWTSAQDVEKWLDDNNINQSLHNGWPILNGSETGYTWINYELIGSSTTQGYRWEIAENPEFEIISW